MKSISYILHMFRRIQDNNYDLSLLLSGSKGFGKSNTALYLSMKYNDMYGFVCPNCGNEFYKNVYAIKNVGEHNEFLIPDYILKDKAWIECSIEERLDLKSGNKIHHRGCGHKFRWSERKKIKWEAKKFITFDAQGLIDLLFNAPPNSPIIADEAFQILGGQNHNRAENKYLKEVINNARPKRHMIFYCIPEVTWLDSKVREGFSSFWLRMIERGHAVLFEKDKGESKDKYHMKELEKIFGTVKFFTPMDKIKRNLRKHPCFFDMFQIPAIPEKIYNDYEMYRNSILLQRQVEELSLSNKDIAKMIIWNLMNNWDRFKIAINQSKENRPTYNLIGSEVVIDPLTRKSLASEPTLRNWVKGVDDYLKSKGADSKIFDGQLEDLKSNVDTKDINTEDIMTDAKPDLDPIKQSEVIEL
jgi:hypothetical protein